MAVIAPFLQRQLYDEAVTEMADELRHKVDLLECSDSDISDNDAKGTARPHWELPKGTNGTAADRADEVLVRKRTNLAAFRRRNRPGSLTGPDKVSNWLLGSKDWSRQFLRSSISSPIIRKSRRSAGAVSGVFVFGGTYSGGPTRHVVSYEEFNNWWLRFNLRGRLEDAFPVLAPNTSGRTSWDVFVLTLVLYSAVTVPLAFSYGLPRYPALDAVEWILTAVYIIDISINFRTAYHDDDGNMVRDSWPVAHRYLITWFPIDFLATVPFDYIGLAAGLGDSESQLMILAVLKTPRLLRLVKLMRLLDRVRNANLFKVLQLILLMMMIAHWLACVWYVIARYAPGGNEWGFDTLDDENRLTWYLSAFYYSFLLLIGDNIQATNNYERLFFILALVAGACFYSAVVGNMALLVANMNTVAVRFRQKLDMTQDALRYMRVPEAQRERVQAFYDFITQFSHPGSEGLGFLSELTKGINEDLHIFLHSGTLMRIYLFKDCEQAFIRSLAMRMKIVTFIPGEVIFRQGDLGHEMYIIRAGCVAVVSKNSEVMSLLQAGDFFGEIALLTQSRRTAKCIALSNCDLAILNSFDIKVLMKEFPKSAHSLQEAARDRLRQLQIAGRAGKGSTPDGDEGDGDEDPDKRREREEVRLQRRSSITRFTTGRGVYSHEMSPVPSDGRAGGSSSCIDGTPQVSPLPLATAPRRDQVTWTTAAPVVSAGGSATAEKRTGVTAAGAAAMTEPPDGPDGNLPPASYVESSRNSYTSLGTEDSAREFVPRRRTNSVTSQGGLSTGASASASASNSRRNSGAGATAQANVVRAACAALSNTAANGDGRLQCSGGSSEPQAVATAIGLCDGGGGSGEPAAAAAAAAVSSTATSQVRPPMNKVRSRSSKAEGVLQNQPKGGGGGGGGDRHGDTSNPNLSQPAAVAAVPRPQQPPSPHVRNPTSSSSSWSALFTRRLGPRPSTPGVSSRRVRSRSSTSGEGTAISVEGQPTVLPVTTAATESPTPAVGASTAVSSTSDGAYLDATTRFDAVERFHPPGPMSPVVLPISAVSPVAVPDAVPTAKKFRASVLLFGRAIRAGPLAEAVEQNAPVLTKQTATMHTKLRAAAALSSMDGSSSGVAPAGCTTMAGGRDPRALQPMGNSRRISAANTVESRSQVLSPVISAAPGRRERRSSLILPYSTSSTTDFAAAVAAAMGIASPLLDSGGGGGGDGRGRVAAGGFANALAATAASVACNGAATGSARGGPTAVDGSRVGQGPITSHDGEAQAVPQIHRYGSSTLCIPLRTPLDGAAAAAAAFMEATSLRTQEGAALSPHLSAQGPYCLMRSAAARRADAIPSPVESPFCLRTVAIEAQGAGMQSPPFGLSPSPTMVNLAGAANGKLQADRATCVEDGDGFCYSALEGTTRSLRALGSMELLQLAPPGYEEMSAEGAGDGTGAGCHRSSGSGTGACASIDRLVRTKQIRTVRRSLQSGAGTLPEAFSTTPAAANMSPEENEAATRRDDDGGAAAAAAVAVIASEDGGDEGFTPVMEWISTTRATTAKARRQRRQSSVGFYPPQPQPQPQLRGSPVNGQAPFTGGGAHVRVASQLAELQHAEAEHMRREAALAQRESDLEHREAELALRHAEAVAALAEATQRREEAAAAMRRTQSVHVMVVALASACADLAFKVEQLDSRLDDTTAAVGRIEAQNGHGRSHGNEFLGLGQPALPALPARDTRPGVLERNASIDKRFAALERTKAFGIRQSLGGGAGAGGGGGSIRHGNAMLHGAGEIGTGSGDVSVSGRRLAIPTSSNASGVESKEAAAAAATTAAAAVSSKIRRSSALRTDVLTTATPSPSPPGFLGRGTMSFSAVPTFAGLVRDSTSLSPAPTVRGSMAESFTAGMQVAGPAAAAAVTGAAAPASTNPLMLLSAALGNSFRKARQESPWSQQASSGAVPATGPAASVSAASGTVHTEVGLQPVTAKSSEIEEQ